MNDQYVLQLDYPPSAVAHPQYGHGAAPRRLLAELLESHEAEFGRRLIELARFRDDYATIALRDPDPVQPSWINDWFPGLDGISLYGLLRAREPARYVEIGSGTSTTFAARARGDGGLPTLIRSIDPQPRRGIDSLCDEIIRQPLELAGLQPFGDLEPGDVLFFDGSHRVFMNSDVTVFFLDILPRLPAGVHVGVHDIYLPDDYPPEIASRYYSEQYLLAMVLLGKSLLRPVLPCWYIHASGRLQQQQSALWEDSRLDQVPRHGATFWLETTGSP